MLSVKAAAARLGVSQSLVYSLCAAGRIKHERHGLGRGRVVIAEEALEAYRRTREREGRPDASPLPLKHITLPTPA